MLFHDDTIGKVVDRYMIERFITSADVAAKKMRIYAENAQQTEVRRHLVLMAEANDSAKKQLEGLLSQFGT